MGSKRRRLDPRALVCGGCGELLTKPPWGRRGDPVGVVIVRSKRWGAATVHRDSECVEAFTYEGHVNDPRAL